MKSLQMDPFIKETMFRGSRMVVADINGLMENYMKDNGKMGLKMALEYGEDQREILISESGEKGKPKAMVFTLGLMAIDMRVNLKIVWSMDKAYNDLPMEIPTKECIK